MRGYQHLTDSLREQVKALYDEGLSYREIEAKTSVSQAAISRLSDTWPKRKKWRGNDGREFIKRDNRFIGYDGESVTANRSATYVLLANSDGESIYNRQGLTTNQCLKFLTLPKQKHTVRCWFRGHYDVNMIVKDLDINQRTALFKTEPVYFGNYCLKYFPHKIFTVRELLAKTSVTYYDVWGFFQSSFEQALKDVLHITDPLISAGKADRANFDFTNPDFIKAYNLRECELLSKLMGEVEQAVTIDAEGIKIKPRSWHGSGAVASAYLSTNKHVKHARTVEGAMSRNDLEPFYKAYYGGRIELKDVGYKQGVYAYDINSAYPHAMCSNPDISKLAFKSGSPMDESLTGVVYLEWDFRDLLLMAPHLATNAAPFPWRSKTGYISYPGIGRGWHWIHEYRALRETPFFEHVKVLDSRLFEYAPSPWSHDIPTGYRLRQQYKAEGNGVQMGLKLWLNSMYGKQAQTRGRGQYRVVIWAGDTTSRTRAALLAPALKYPNDVFAFATDSIYSTTPLDLPVSKNLGDWDYTYHPSTTLLLPGLGELENEGGKPKKLKVRGMPSFDLHKAIEDIYASDDGSATIFNRVFVTHALADSQPKAYGDKRGRVITELDQDCPTKQIRPFNNLKRDYDFHHVTNPHKKFRLSENYWTSSMALDLRGEENGTIVDSYPMTALELNSDPILVDAEISAQE